MSDISEEEWKAALTSVLEELDPSQFNKMLECLRKIPKGQKTTRSQEQMPQKIIEHYGLEESISAISDAMDQIPRRDSAVQNLLRPFVDKLRNTREKGNKGKTRNRDAAEQEKRSAADRQKSCRLNEERNTHWKKSICDVKSSSKLSNIDGIAGKVVQKSGLYKYQTNDNEKDFFFNVAVADETDSIKMMVYGKTHHREIQQEKSYLFRKLIRAESVVKVTTLSKVTETSSVKVPEKLETEARELMNSDSPVFSIAKAKSSADKTGVSVVGTVAEIDPIERVKVQQKKTRRQTLQLNDETGSIRICMWGENTEQCKGLSAGDVINVTNMTTNQHHETVLLDSTGLTRVHKVHSFGKRMVRINIIGIKKATKRETHLDAELNRQVHSFVVASGLLAKTFGFKLRGNFKDRVLGELPLTVDAVIQGSKINKLSAA